MIDEQTPCQAQKLLDDIIENTLVMVEDLIHISDNEKTNEGGIRLLKHAPPGIVFDHMGKWTSSNIFTTFVN